MAKIDAFEPELLRDMGVAFDYVMACLNGVGPFPMDWVASYLVHLAQTGETDPNNFVALTMEWVVRSQRHPKRVVVVRERAMRATLPIDSGMQELYMTTARKRILTSADVPG